MQYLSISKTRKILQNEIWHEIFFAAGCFWLPSIAVSVPYGYVTNEVINVAAAQCRSHQRSIDGNAVERARGVDHPGDTYNGQFQFGWVNDNFYGKLVADLDLYFILDTSVEVSTIQKAWLQQYKARTGSAHIARSSIVANLVAAKCAACQGTDLNS